MTFRQFWVTLIVVSLLTVGRYVVGDGLVAIYLVVMGSLGVLATVIYYRRRARLARRLNAMSEIGQQRTLLLLENSALRPAMVRDLDLTAPPVPLRGPKESFRYPPDAARTGTWIMYACVWLAGFVVLGTLSDLIWKTYVFIERGTAWWDISTLFFVLVAGALFMHWSVQQSRGVLEITDDGISWLAPGRQPRVIRWTEVTEARLGEFPQSIRIRSRTARISASNALIDCGRAINLIATRLPQTIARHA